LVRREKVTLIHATEPCLRGFVALLLGWFARIPWCVSIHADYDVRFRLAGRLEAPMLFGSRSIARRVERFVLSRAPLILPIRESLKEYVRRLGVSTERVRIIPHGIDFTPFLRQPVPTFAAQYGFEGKLLVVFVGRLARDNCVLDIPRIARLVLERRADVVFVLLGDGRERQVLERMVREFGLEGAVAFLGFQPQKTVADFRVNADVQLCLMGGYSLIEAAASGRPVVAYDVEWHSELVRNGESGLLVKEGDQEAVAEAILTLLQSPDLAFRLGEAARTIALRSYSLEMSRAKKINLYQDLLRHYAI
jgi:glycosyltransferase involved in cell wall biosynthesis